MLTPSTTWFQATWELHEAAHDLDRGHREIAPRIKRTAPRLHLSPMLKSLEFTNVGAAQEIVLGLPPRLK